MRPLCIYSQLVCHGRSKGFLFIYCFIDIEKLRCRRGVGLNLSEADFTTASFVCPYCIPHFFLEWDLECQGGCKQWYEQNIFIISKPENQWERLVHWLTWISEILENGLGCRSLVCTSHGSHTLVGTWICIFFLHWWTADCLKWAPHSTDGN